MSVGRDRYVKVFDTETGKLVSKHTTKHMPVCGKFHPTRNNEMLVGQQNKMLVQWDLNANTVRMFMFVRLWRSRSESS